MYTAYIDLDDTLLDDKKNISDYTYNVLAEFQRQGNNIVFATARSRRLHELQKKLEQLTPHFIFHNGGEIISDGVIVHQCFFSVSQTQKIGTYLTQNSLRAAVILDEEYYANYDAPSVWGVIDNFQFTTFFESTFRAPKFSVLLDSEIQIELINALEQSVQITYIDNCSNVILAPKNVSKGSAVRFLQQKFLRDGTSIYFGNDYNDLSGFDSCDIKIAVANAEKIVLNSADIIIGSNQADGVAHYLSKLLTL